MSSLCLVPFIFFWRSLKFLFFVVSLQVSFFWPRPLRSPIVYLNVLDFFQDVLSYKKRSRWNCTICCFVWIHFTTRLCNAQELTQLKSNWFVCKHTVEVQQKFQVLRSNLKRKFQLLTFLSSLVTLLLTEAFSNGWPCKALYDNKDVTHLHNQQS